MSLVKVVSALVIVLAVATSSASATTYNISTLDTSPTLAHNQGGFVYNGESLGNANAFLLGSLYPNLLGILAHPARNAKSLADFNLAPLAGVTSGQVTSAFLDIRSIVGPLGASVSPAHPVVLNLLQSSAAWNIDTVTYNTFPAGSLISQTSISQTGVTYHIDVTSVVQGWLANPATDFGFLLAQDGPGVLDDTGAAVAAWFDLNQSGGNANRATLVVNTVPEPSTWVLMGIALPALIGWRLSGRHSKAA